MEQHSDDAGGDVPRSGNRRQHREVGGERRGDNLRKLAQIRASANQKLGTAFMALAVAFLMAVAQQAPRIVDALLDVAFSGSEQSTAPGAAPQHPIPHPQGRVPASE